MKDQLYEFGNALNLIKDEKKTKFLEGVDVSINLNITPKNKNFVIKGYSVLPHGVKKQRKIAIFSDKGEYFPSLDDSYIFLKESDLLNLNKKNINFDLMITTPSSIIKFGKLGKILNGKKLMPDVKYGTITTDIMHTLDLLKKNYVRFRNDKGNVINSSIGSIDLSENQLFENLRVLITDIKQQKPKECKDLSIKSIYLTSTMGNSFKLDIKSLF